MEIAKKHDLTCITADLQVVHAGAYLTNAGHYNRASLDRFTLYQQIKQAKSEVDDRRAALDELLAQKDACEKQDQEAQ